MATPGLSDCGSDNNNGINYTMPIKLACVQMSPIFLDKSRTTAKVCEYILKAGSEGANVVGFPECIIPGYPGWAEALPLDRTRAHDFYKKMFLESVEVPGPECEQIASACARAKTYAIVGITERIKHTTGTTYNTQLIFGPDGNLLLKRQKFVPTLTERLIHAPGNTGSQVSVSTPFGTLSGMICGENANSLATYSLATQYPVVHVASWPPHFSPETSMQDCILNSTRGLAYSLKCFVLNAVGVVADDAIESYGDQGDFASHLEELKHKGHATIIGPDGNILAGPLGAGDGILYAEVQAQDVLIPKYTHDISGHYQRPELFAHLFASS